MRVVRSLVALAGLTLCMLAKPSEAGTLEVRFALGGGQISLAVAGFGSSNLQTMFTGTARVVLMGVDALGEITDRTATASLLDVDVLVNLTIPVLGGTFPFRFNQVAPVTGPFDGTTLGIPPQGLRIRSTNAAGGMADSSNQMSLAVQLALLDTSGASQLILNSLLSGQGSSLRFDIVGREVSRNFVPEPAEIALIAIGVTLLLGSWIIRAGRRWV